MTAQTYTAATEISPEELSRLQTQLDGKTQDQKAQSRGFRPAAIVSTRQEITFRNGQVSEQTSVNKSAGPRMEFANQPKPGMVNIGGVETSVAAAKAAGLLPAHWQEGQPLPFDQAPTQGAHKAPQGTSKATLATDAGNPDKAPQESPDAATAHAQHLAKIAGDILHGVQQVHGPGVAEPIMSEVAENGDPASIMQNLPAGVTETHAKQVYAGFRAAADHAFAQGGSSLAAVEELLNEDELRNARRFTLANNPEALADLGRVAVERLAQLPEGEAWDWIADLPTKERGYFTRTKDKGITFAAPGMPEMSWGAAVRLGIVKV